MHMLVISPMIKEYAQDHKMHKMYAEAAAGAKYSIVKLEKHTMGNLVNQSLLS